MKKNLIKKIILLLSPVQRIKASILVFLSFFSTLMEVFGLGLLIVIMNFFLESEGNNNSFFYSFLNRFVADKESSFFLVLTIFFTILFLTTFLFVFTLGFFLTLYVVLKRPH